MAGVISIAGFELDVIRLLVIATVAYLLTALLQALSPSHPLASFPGPLSSRLSRLPILWTRWRGTEPADMAALHALYGPVVRFAPNALSFISSAAWRDIHGLHRHSIVSESGVSGSGGVSGGKLYTLPKDPSHYGPTTDDSSSIISTSPEAHMRQRRLLGQGFSEKALRGQEALLQGWADLLIEKLRETCENQGGEAEVDMVSWFNFATFDIMADLTFAEPLHMLQGSAYSPWVAKIFASIKIAARMRVLSDLPFVGWILPSLLGRLFSGKKREHEAYVTERVDRRMAKADVGHPDLWSYILRRNEQDEGAGLTKEEMYSNASLFMIAGTETTATLLSGATYLLLTNPSHLHSLKHTLRTHFPSSSSSDPSTPLPLDALLPSTLPLLTATLKESLRLYPPVPLGLPRIVPAPGHQIAGTFVPANTVVQVDHWSSYHSPANFHNPEKFAPERWLDDDARPDCYKDDDKAAFQPFSSGPRNCLGKNLAYHEARLLLAKVLLNFDLELVDKERKWTDQGVFFLWDKPKLMVKLKPVR